VSAMKPSSDMDAWTITFPMGRLCLEPVAAHVWDEGALSL
jgi:hypothetical protein